MSEKIYVRKVERFTQWQASQPIEIDVETLRKCTPPYEGDSHEELIQYLSANVYNNYDWVVDNEEIYETAYDLCMDESPEMDVYSDSRNKFEDSWIEIGIPNEEYRKTGMFESYANTMEENGW
jgi:hypothetical protein